MSKGKRFGLIITSLLFLLSGAAGCGADNAGGTLVEQSASVDAATEEVTQESAKNREEQEVSIESKDDLIGRDTQENSGILETEPEVKPESEANETSIEEIDDMYGFGPVSYDLSNLPAMENKLYAEWNGNIYFRQYSDEDTEEGALWANFGYVPDTEKEIMCLKPDGTLTQMGTDYGHGTMFIANGRIYSQRYTKRKYSTGDDFYDPVVYSCELDGSERKVQALSFDTKFYLYDDGANKALLCSTIDNVREVTPVCLEGEAPQDIVLRIANGFSYDEPYVHSSTAYDPLHHSVYPDTSVLLYPDTSGICYALLTEQDCEELSVDAYVDGHFSQDIKDVEYLAGKLFFTVTDLTYSVEDSIGWRDGYVRGRTACYCKDMESGEIRLLYEY